MSIKNPRTIDFTMILDFRGLFKLLGGEIYLAVSWYTFVCFILHIHLILHFYVPRLKFLEPKWSHHNSSKIVETFFFLLIFLSSYFSTICIANSI